MVKIGIIGTGGFIAPAIIDSLKTLTKDKVEFPIKAITSQDKPSDEYLEYLKASLDDESVIDHFKGVDVVMFFGKINPTTSQNIKKLLETVKPKVYMPSEYGSDLFAADYSLLHPHLKHKVEHINDLASVDVKIVRVITGYFKFPPVFLYQFVAHVGINLGDKTVTYYGSPDTELSYSKLKDVANATATIAVTEVDKLQSKYVIKSHSLPLKEFVHKYEQENGIELTPIYNSREEARALGEEVAKKPEPTFEDLATCLLVMLGLGPGNGALFEEFDNEVINPGESLWKWEDSY